MFIINLIIISSDYFLCLVSLNKQTNSCAFLGSPITPLAPEASASDSSEESSFLGGLSLDEFSDLLFEFDRER